MHFVSAIAVPSSLLFVSIVIHHFARCTSLPYLIDLLLEHDTDHTIPPIPLEKTDPTSSNHSNSPVIPNIIHQTYPNATIPDHWLPSHNSCRILHPSPSYEHILWTDSLSLSFLESHYPWFLSTYLSYPYDIQRADSIRYFVLRHFGGTYLDLDVGCARSIEPLNSFPAWVHRTSPSGISNEAMGGQAGHAFWTRVTEELEFYAHNWGSPYVTVMYSTGPLFLSVVWRKWVREGKDVGEHRVMIMSEEMFNHGEKRFFAPVGGSTWHAWDVKAVLWVREYWIVLLLAVVSSLVAFRFVGRIFMVGRRAQWLGLKKESVEPDWLEKARVV